MNLIEKTICLNLYNACKQAFENSNRRSETKQKWTLSDQKSHEILKIALEHAKDMESFKIIMTGNKMVKEAKKMLLKRESKTGRVMTCEERVDLLTTKTSWSLQTVCSIVSQIETEWYGAQK